MPNINSQKGFHIVFTVHIKPENLVFRWVFITVELKSESEDFQQEYAPRNFFP